MLEELLENLTLSSDESGLYLYLLEKGPQTAGRLAQQLGYARPTLYDMLARMQEKGVVLLDEQRTTRTYGAEPPHVLEHLFQKRVDYLKAQQKKFQSLLPELEKRASTRMLTPRFQFFEGMEGVQNVLKDFLLYRDIETFSFWPIKSMVEVLSGEFFHWHNKQRIRQNISVRAIWPAQEVVDIKIHPALGHGKEYLREIRVAPTDVHFTLGYWCYANKAAFLSSQAECFGYIIESAEMVAMLKAQHDIVWNLSRKLEADPEDMRPFIEELDT
jgi:HTH-type transcriptional regulator, sugar sensing transcriptional regulator